MAETLDPTFPVAPLPLGSERKRWAGGNSFSIKCVHLRRVP